MGSVHRSNKEERMVGEWCPLVAGLTEAGGVSLLHQGLYLSGSLPG